MDPRIFVDIGIVACSWIMLTYHDYAVQNGHSIKKFFLPENGKIFKLFSATAGMYFTIAGAVYFGWYYFLLIPIVSFIVAFALTRVFVKHVQIIGPIGLVILVLADILMQIDEQQLMD
jgi:hypothetical protein